MIENKRNINPMVSGLAFSAVMLLVSIFGFYFQKRELYTGLLISEFIMILMPCLALAFIFKLNLKETFRLNATKPVNFVIAFFIAVLAIPAMIPINLGVLILEKLIFGKIIMPEVPNAGTPIELLIYIGIIACSPAICEELMFRGIIQKGLEKMGVWFSIIGTGFLFGLFHVYMQKFFPTFVLGVLFAFVAYKTKSIYTTMLMHFVNNAISVIVGYVSFVFVKGQKDMMSSPDQAIETILKMPTAQIVGVFIVYGFMFAALGTVVGVLIYLLVRINPQSGNKLPLVLELNRVQKVIEGKFEQNKDAEIKLQSIDNKSEFNIENPNSSYIDFCEPKKTNEGKYRLVGLLAFLPGLIVVALFYQNELVFLQGGKDTILRSIYQFFNLI